MKYIILIMSFCCASMTLDAVNPKTERVTKSARAVRGVVRAPRRFECLSCRASLLAHNFARHEKSQKHRKNAIKAFKNLSK